MDEMIKKGNKIYTKLDKLLAQSGKCYAGLNFLIIISIKGQAA